MNDDAGMDALVLAIETGERPPCDICELSQGCATGRLACAEYWKYVRGKADANFGISVFGVSICKLPHKERFTPSTRIYKEIYGDF